MTTQPEALRLADVLDHVELRPSDYKDVDKAAAELRRLHALNGELLEVLREAELVLAEKLRRLGADPNVSPTTHRIRAAIAKAEGGQP